MEPQMDMQQLFAAAQQMQEQLVSAQQALADAEVTGTAGGGLVTATVSGQGVLEDLTIAPAAIDPGESAEETARTVADLVLAAVRAAYQAAEDLQNQKMGPFAAALQGGLPGMPGMPGGGGLDLPSGLDLSGLGLGGPAPGGPDPSGPDPSGERREEPGPGQDREP